MAWHSWSAFRGGKDGVWELGESTALAERKQPDSKKVPSVTRADSVNDFFGRERPHLGVILESGYFPYAVRYTKEHDRDASESNTPVSITAPFACDEIRRYPVSNSV